MQLRAPFAESRCEILHALIRAQPLGTLIASVDGEIVVNHLPFLLVPDGGRGSLHGHLPRANVVWQAFDGTVPALVVFQGPDCYVSPSWYPSKQAHGRVVPTWNYVVVHARGRPRAIADRAWLLDHLAALTAAHESMRPEPWTLDDAPADYIERMAGELLGIEIPIENLIGKWKVSQNRPAPDRLAVAAALDAEGSDRSLAMARLVRAALADSGDDTSSHDKKAT